MKSCLKFVAQGRPPSAEVADGFVVRAGTGSEDPDELLVRARLDASGAKAVVVVALRERRLPDSVDSVVGHVPGEVVGRRAVAFVGL